MKGRDELVRLFSEFWRIDASKVKDTLALDDNTLDNHSSVRFYQFIAAVESNLDVEVADVNRIKTFGDLAKNMKPLG